MKSKRNSEYDSMDRATRIEVQLRDNQRCRICGDKFMDIHEIIPRRELHKKSIDLLFSPINRVCLCRECHNNASAFKSVLINDLHKEYGYPYEKISIFRKYLEDINE